MSYEESETEAFDLTEPTPIPDQYIVVFNAQVLEGERLAHRNWVVEAMETYSRTLTAAQNVGDRAAGRTTGVLFDFDVCDGVFSGYVGAFPRDLDHLVTEIRQRPEVAYVENDYRCTAFGLKTVDTPSWGLARLSILRPFILVNSSNAPLTYTYDTAAAGQGITVYIFDTGVFVEHPDFEDRASFGYNHANDVNRNRSPDTDTDGHGTISAGIIGGKLHGVAKKAKLISVKVLHARDTSKTYAASNIIAGLDWVSKDAESRGFGKCVVNMSLGVYCPDRTWRCLNNAVNALIEHRGITVVAAAGNNGSNAYSVSPASSEKVITVGAIGVRDELTHFTNLGPDVNIFAPGTSIISTTISRSGDDASPTVRSGGTSVAAPHVSGLVACLLSGSEPPKSPAEARRRLMDLAQHGGIHQRRLGETNSPNVIANKGLDNVHTA